jgi:hypothetical protein
MADPIKVRITRLAERAFTTMKNGEKLTATMVVTTLIKMDVPDEYQPAIVEAATLWMETVAEKIGVNDMCANGHHHVHYKGLQIFDPETSTHLTPEEAEARGCDPLIIWAGRLTTAYFAHDDDMCVAIWNAGVEMDDTTGDFAIRMLMLLSCLTTTFTAGRELQERMNREL